MKVATRCATGPNIAAKRIDFHALGAEQAGCRAYMFVEGGRG